MDIRTTSGDLDNSQGRIFSGGNAMLTSAAGIGNDDTGGVNASGQQLGITATGTLNVDSQNQIRSLHGMMAGNGDVTITSHTGTIESEGGHIQSYAGNMLLTATGVNNRYGGVIDSAGWLTANLNGGPLTSLRNRAGWFHAGGDVTVNAPGQLVGNASGVISSSQGTRMLFSTGISHRILA